jgi:hypothetical protein
MRITRKTTAFTSTAAVGAIMVAALAVGAPAASASELTAQHMNATVMKSVKCLSQHGDTTAIKTIAKALKAATAQQANPQKVALLVNQAKAELDQLAQNTAAMAPHQEAQRADTVTQTVDDLKSALDAVTAAVTAQNPAQLDQAVQDVLTAVTNLNAALNGLTSGSPLSPTMSTSPNVTSINGLAQQRPTEVRPNDTRMMAPGEAVANPSTDSTMGSTDTSPAAFIAGN